MKNNPEIKKNNNLDNLKIKVELIDINIFYSNLHAIENVSLKIPEKKVTAVIGPSGCGKSTLIKSINRMIEVIPGAYVKGKVLFDGLNIYDEKVDPVDIRIRTGKIFQKPNPFPMSVFENVAFGLRIQGVKDRNVIEETVLRSLEQAALLKEVKNKLKNSAMDLSGGQQQRLCIARALAVSPEVLLMDEPCSALDPISTQRIEDLIESLKKELTIVIVTHNMQQAARVSDFTAFLLSEEEGQPAILIEYGNTNKIFTRPKNKKTEDFITGRFG